MQFRVVNALVRSATPLYDSRSSIYRATRYSIERSVYALLVRFMTHCDVGLQMKQKVFDCIFPNMRAQPRQIEAASLVKTRSVEDIHQPSNQPKPFCLSQFSLLVINGIIAAIGLAAVTIALAILLTTPVIGPAVAAVGITLGAIGLFNAYRHKSDEEHCTTEAGNMLVPA